MTIIGIIIGGQSYKVAYDISELSSCRYCHCCKLDSQTCKMICNSIECDYFTLDSRERPLIDTGVITTADIFIPERLQKNISSCSEDCDYHQFCSGNCLVIALAGSNDYLKKFVKKWKKE